jgi:hypothetical protein
MQSWLAMRSRAYSVGCVPTAAGSLAVNVAMAVADVANWKGDGKQVSKSTRGLRPVWASPMGSLFDAC